MNSVHNKAVKLIECGAEISSNVTGTAIGFLFGGPAGAIAGAALSPVTKRVVEKICVEIYDRVQGNRQRIRAGAVIAHAIQSIKEKIENGCSVRDDDFFDTQNKRSKAEEILEGVIIKSQNEHEEKKAKFYANIFSSIAFNKDITTESANYILLLASRLTYRHLCLLHIFFNHSRHQLRSIDYRESGIGSPELQCILSETIYLYLNELIYSSPEEGDSLVLNFSYEIIPASIRLTKFGTQVYHIMGLEKIEANDTGAILQGLK